MWRGALVAKRLRRRPGVLLTETVDRLTAALADRYTLERELGRGGMATVWLARDRKHDRKVALKLLRPELSAIVGTERFLREIRLTARLQHPHILPLIDSGEATGLLYYVMPYVEGESLRQRLERDAQLPLEEALHITRGVATALEYAHANGVTHRDIKPENILLYQGEPMVADFGIALAAASAGRERLTETGLAVGTPPYMSPEQASGGSLVDGRADIYALGCVLYEMLSGSPPFTGASAQAVLARHSVDPVPPLRTVRKAVSPRLEQVVLKALEKVPADRYSTAGAMAEALAAPMMNAPVRHTMQRSLVASGLLLAAVGGSWLTMTSDPAPGEPTLAVLPCINTRADSTPEYLSDGMTEDLITRLSQSGTLAKVISTTSVMQYKYSAESPEEIGAELDVSLLLSCRYEQGGDRDRLALQLVNSSDGTVRWAQVYERELSADHAVLPASVLGDVLRAAGVRQALAPPVMSQLEETYDRVAINLNKEGQFFLNKYTREGLQRSIVLFRQALERDSTLTDAYIGLGNAYSNLGIAHGEQDPREAFPLVREMAERALALDSTSAAAHALLGVYEYLYGWNWNVARLELERAVQLDPSSAFARDNLAFVYSILGRFDDAIREAVRSTELDPVSAMVWADAGVQYYTARRYAEALPYVKHAVELEPGGPPYHWLLGAIYTELGDLRKAVEKHERTIQLAGGGEQWRAHLGYTRALLGDTAGAHVILQRLDSLWSVQENGKLACAMALVYVGLGDRDAAFHWWDEAYRLRCSTLPFDATTPPGHRLASDPRYAALLRRLGLRR